MATVTALEISGEAYFVHTVGGNARGPTPKPLSPAGQDPAEREVCIANISPRERLRRLISGVIPFLLALALLTWQVSEGIDRLWRLPLLLLFVAAATGFFQWRDKT